MPEWLVEDGIGETRAILVEGGVLRAARIERRGGLAPGLVADAVLVSRHKGSSRGGIRFAGGQEASIDGLDPSAGEGAPLRVEVTRAAIAERGRLKRAQTRPTQAPPRPAPSLAQRLARDGTPVRVVTRFPDDPWPELVAQAAEGTIDFPGGSLILATTPAMTLIDIDGTLPPRALALAAVPAIARAAAHLDLAGSIGIDFPSLDRREDRRAIDEALAMALSGWAHQRTAMNGFGFVQLVTRLERPSLPQVLNADPAVSHALLLLRQAEGLREPGLLTLTAHPRVRAAVTPQWQAELERRAGRRAEWKEDAGLAFDGGFAQVLRE